jgi:uncharacterized repeat protein (TIGR01451 family)
MNKLYSIVFGVLLASAAHAATSDVAVAVSDSPDPVRVGQSLTYRVAVTNRGPHNATNTVVTDVLPVEVDFVSCSLSQGSYSQQAGTVYCNLGIVNNGATAAVTIVVNPLLTGFVTNQASISSDSDDPDTANNRASCATEIKPANRAPEIAVPGPHVLPVGAVTSFLVTVSDVDHDAVTRTNTVKPAGATYVGDVFCWTATVARLNTTNDVVFVANDQQGLTNSVVTNQTTIVVPYDSESDGLDDGWEWTCFSSLTNTPTGDRDGDGHNNRMEYIAGTHPTNVNSKFHVMAVTNALGASASNHVLRVTTEPSRRYTIYWKDTALTNSGWTVFANTNWGVWRETNAVSTNHVFTDNESTNTTGGKPAGGWRYYRVRVSMP